MVLHNPNNWHWVDKNCIQWTREYFDRVLIGIKAEEGDVTAEITSINDVSGDVDVCQRKGKVISLFDIVISLRYKGKVGDQDVDGRVYIPEVAYDTEPDEYQFTVENDKDERSKAPVKALIRKDIVPQLRILLSKFGPDLLETHGKDIQHPDASIHSNSSSVTPASLSTASLSSSSVVGTAAYNTTSLRLEPVFNAPAHQLYDALIKPDMVALWTRSKPDIAPVVGTNYTLFNGTISGKITDLVENSRIEMTWRLKDWKQGHFAILSLDFLQGAGETTIKVNWTGVPIGQEEVVQTNFEEYYVKPIKLTFGFGTVL